MDADSIVRQQEGPELPSEAMRAKFELWNEEYKLDVLTDLTISQLKSRRQKFEAEVQVLLAKHRPGKIVAERPSLAHIYGKPPYTAEEWERAREMIRNKAEKVRLRLERAEGVVAKEETEARLAWTTKLVESFPMPDFNINLS